MAVEVSDMLTRLVQENDVIIPFVNVDVTNNYFLFIKERMLGIVHIKNVSVLGLLLTSVVSAAHLIPKVPDALISLNC